MFKMTTFKFNTSIKTFYEIIDNARTLFDVYFISGFVKRPFQLIHGSVS